MNTKSDLGGWVLEALHQLGGSATVIDVCKIVWQRHEHDLRASGDLFFTWQYDIRWAAQELRNDGTLAPTSRNSRSPWTLSNGAEQI